MKQKPHFSSRPKTVAKPDAPSAVKPIVRAAAKPSAKLVAKPAPMTAFWQRDFFKILVLFLVWRLGLLLVGGVAGIFFKFEPTFVYAADREVGLNLPQWLASWANFDGVHYLTIARDGYQSARLIQAFFPVYPLLIEFFSSGKNFMISGFVISNLASLLLYYVWFKFLQDKLGKKGAWFGVLLLMLFPTSFYFGAVYTESLFFLLALSAFRAVDSKKWRQAALLIALASATRVVGVILVPILILELFMRENKLETGWDLWNKVQNEKPSRFAQQLFKFFIKKRRRIVLLASGSVGLLAYMFYLNRFFGDALLFLHVQNEFGGFRSESMVLYPQVVWRSLKILATNSLNWRYLTYSQEAVAGILGVGVVLLTLRRVKLTYILFSLGLILVPTSTGTFSSMPRYILPAFVIYMWLIEVLKNRPVAKLLFLVVSGLLLVINTMLFIQGYWVA